MRLTSLCSYKTPTTVGVPPSPRHGHSAVQNIAQPRYIYYYGGTTELQEQCVLNLLLRSRSLLYRSLTPP